MVSVDLHTTGFGRIHVQAIHHSVKSIGWRIAHRVAVFASQLYARHENGATSFHVADHELRGTRYLGKTKAHIFPFVHHSAARRCQGCERKRDAPHEIHRLRAVRQTQDFQKFIDVERDSRFGGINF